MGTASDSPNNTNSSSEGTTGEARLFEGRRVFADRYILERKLGQGGMGEVWLARDSELNERRALKFLPQEVTRDERTMLALKQEAQKGIRLAHPRIVRIHDFLREGDECALAMEYVAGHSLEHVLSKRERGFFEVENIAGWVKDIVAALAHAHEQGLVHRDVKPSNILIDETGHAKLMDFGVSRPMAKKLDPGPDPEMFGTLCYVSPQQLQADAPSPSDDIYSLAAMVYELLTGRPPFFRGDLAEQIRAKIPLTMSKRREALASEGLVRKGGSEIPRAWEEAVRLGLAKSTKDRPSNIVAWWKLTQLLLPTNRAQRGRSRRTPTRSTRGRLARRTPNSGALPALSLCGVFVAAAVGFLYWQHRQRVLAVHIPTKIAENVLPTPAAPTAGASGVEMETLPPKPVESPRNAEPDPVIAEDKTAEIQEAVRLEDATKERPWANSLGMTFVPVRVRGGRRVYFCQHETRVKDYAVFVKESGGTGNDAWKDPKRDGVPVCPSEECPTVNVSWEDAKAFCAWLSKQEGMEYRLPSDDEWSWAVGIGEQESGTASPQEKHLKVKEMYPWGRGFPPKGNLGNYADQTAKEMKVKTYGAMEGYRDGHATTSPAKWFDQNELGLYDLGGNVWEWCEDWYDADKGRRVLRGGAWFDFVDSDLLLSCYRNHSGPEDRVDYIGFRLVAGGSAPPIDFGQSQITRSAKTAGSAPPIGFGQSQITRSAKAAPPSVKIVQKQPFTNSLGMRMQWIPEGTFRMGSPNDEAGRDGGREFQVRVRITRGFWLGKHEVTQGEWVELMGSNPSRFKAPDQAEDYRKRLPVDSVSWDICQEFLKKLHEREAGSLPPGYHYELPTEAEWEYACRAGTRTAIYNGRLEVKGRFNAPKLDPIAWYSGNCSVPYNDGENASGWTERQYPFDKAGTHPVGTKLANQWGLHDTIGNVAEWCMDWYTDRVSGGDDPLGPQGGRGRVIRGGAWGNPANELRAASRGGHEPQNALGHVGFRVALRPRVDLAQSPLPALEVSSRKPGEEMANGLGMALCWIPSGNFIMGSPKEEARRGGDENQVPVAITRGFWLGKYEVTQQEWKRLMMGNPSHFKGDKLPVEQVSWDETRKFLAMLNQQEGKSLPSGYRYGLPSEAEWEYACRAGGNSPFHFGAQLNGNDANCLGTNPYGTETKGPNLGMTATVGSYRANPWGLYDMHGNVREWCEDWYGQKLPGGVNPKGPSSGPDRVVRGGSWNDSGWNCRSACRGIAITGNRGNSVGFRVALKPF